MIIDCHTHLGRNDHIRADVKELLESMDAAKIDKSLVFAGELNDYPTDMMLEEIKPHRDRLYGVASWDFQYALSHRNMKPYEQQDKLVKLYKEGEIVAVKFYTGYYHTMPYDLSHVLWRLNEVGCPAIFHCGDCLNSCKHAKLRYAHPLNIDDVAVDYPNMNFIIAHMGYPWHRDAAEVCYKNKNVYSDISGFVYKHFDGDSLPKFQKTLHEFLEIADSDRLLFGTDFPISHQGSYLDALDWVSAHTTNKKLSEVFSPQYMTQNVKRAFKL